MSAAVDVSVGAAMAEAAARLAAAGIETARLDARLLLGHALGRDAGWLIGHRDDILSAAERADFETLVRRREGREPLAYILGTREFWSLLFRVTPATLIPRPETEILVEAVLDAFAASDAVFRIADLGTGTGCVMLSILNERPVATGVGIDLSTEALAVARGNAAALGLGKRAEFRQGSWFAALGADEVFDVIVTNPPYISDAEMAALAPEIANHEPLSALTAGRDGLDAYRRIFPGLAGRLRAGGLFAGEIGHLQGNAAAALAREQGLEKVEILADAAGRPRCVLGRMGNDGNI